MYLSDFGLEEYKKSLSFVWYFLSILLLLMKYAYANRKSLKITNNSFNEFVIVRVDKIKTLKYHEDVAKNMIKARIDYDTISNITGLPII